MVRECEPITEPIPLRQGDVIEWVESSSDPWAGMGVIITADCDIEHEKHRGILSYCPIVTLRDYLSRFYLSKRLRRKLRPVEEQIISRIREIQSERRPDFPEPLSSNAIKRWAREVSPAAILSQLGMSDGRPSEDLQSLLLLYQDTRRALDSPRFDAMVELLQGFDAGASEEQRAKFTAKLTQEISSFVRNLPGDSFFVAKIDEEHAGGYVAYLRLVREINQREIALKQVDLRDSAVKARRLGRLESPYRYRLTQQIVGVFSSIGLPPEYEQFQQRTVSALMREP